MVIKPLGWKKAFQTGKERMDAAPLGSKKARLGKRRIEKPTKPIAIKIGATQIVLPKRFVTAPIKVSGGCKVGFGVQVAGSGVKTKLSAGEINQLKRALKEPLKNAMHRAAMTDAQLKKIMESQGFELPF